MAKALATSDPSTAPTAPAASTAPRSSGPTAAAVAQGVRARSGRLVLLAADSSSALTASGAGPVRQVADRTVHEDARLLEQRPDRLVPLAIQVWTAPVPG